MLQIIEVKLQSAKHLLHGVGVSIVERGVGCHPRTNLVETRIASIMLHDLVDVELALRTRTDERHVSDEDIPKLGQLIEVMCSQKLPHLGEARVATYLQQVGTILLGIHPHATKLVDEERLAMQSDALLLVDDRQAILHADGKSYHQAYRREYHQT